MYVRSFETTRNLVTIPTTTSNPVANDTFETVIRKLFSFIKKPFSFLTS